MIIKGVALIELIHEAVERGDYVLVTPFSTVLTGPPAEIFDKLFEEHIQLTEMLQEALRGTQH